MRLSAPSAREHRATFLNARGVAWPLVARRYGQFVADCNRPSRHFKEFEKVLDIWKERVQPMGVVE